MKKFKIAIGIVGTWIVLFLMGCVEEYEANLSGMPTEGLVVEGNIISDSVVVFNLSKTLPLSMADDKYNDYTDVNAELSVKGSDGTSWAGVRKEKGKYLIDIGTLKPEVDYHLEILYNGETYRSEPQKPLKTVKIDRLLFNQPNLNGPVIIQLGTEKEDVPQYFLWYFEEDWEVRANFQTTALYDATSDRIVSYLYPPVAQGWCHYGTDKIILGTTESNVENRILGKIIRTIENDDRRLSCLYSIRVEQRNLTRKEYEYYQVRSKLNSDMGGLFTPQPSELPTNITCSNPSNKVIGYVGCNMGVAYSQLYIKEEEVMYIDHYLCETGKAPGGSSREKYEAGFQIADRNPLGVEWAKAGCVDVRKWAANPMGRPSWWPNPYLYIQGMDN